MAGAAEAVAAGEFDVLALTLARRLVRGGDEEIGHRGGLAHRRVEGGVVDLANDGVGAAVGQQDDRAVVFSVALRGIANEVVGGVGVGNAGKPEMTQAVSLVLSRFSG